jgi:hypothetical protein
MNAHIRHVLLVEWDTGSVVGEIEKPRSVTFNEKTGMWEIEHQRGGRWVTTHIPPSRIVRIVEHGA